MPNNDSERAGESILARMSISELEELLRQMPLDDINTGYWDAVMSEYMRRGAAPAVNTEEALQSFHENYSGGKAVFADGTEFGDESTAGKAPAARATGRRRLARLGLTAAIIAALLMAWSVTASAMGYDLWAAVAEWTGEHFGFSREVEAGPALDELDTAEAAFAELRAALDEYGVTENVVPTYIPDGYKHTAVTCLENGESIIIIDQYTNGDDTMILQYLLHGSVIGGSYSKDTGDPKVYTSGGIEHYIMANNGKYLAAWQNGPIECCISGVSSEAELEAVICSIYEGD